MPLLSRITTRRWPSIKGVCSSWDGPSPITPTTARKPNRRSRRSHLLSARPRRRLPAGYFGPATLAACAKRDSEPYIATGRDPHHPSWLQRFAPLSDPPPVDASSEAQDGLQAQDRPGQSHLRRTHMYRRTGDWHHQAGARLPSVLLARGTGGGWRVVPG